MSDVGCILEPPHPSLSPRGGEGSWKALSSNSLRVRRGATHSCLLAIVIVGLVGASPPDSIKTISVDLKLRTGGELSGAVIDHDAHGLVILHENTPYVFGWRELDGGSAFAARRSLLILARGDADQLSADDHFDLGTFALAQGRNDLAAGEFDRAKNLRRDLSPRIRLAFEDFRRRQSSRELTPLPVREVEQAESDRQTMTPSKPSDGGSPLPDLQDSHWSSNPPPEIRQRVHEAYLQFGAQVVETMGKDITLIESDHFMIWTDWEKKERGRLTDWCEAMYAALCGQFGLDARDDIFLAKCPIFVFRSKARFRTFARDFDGYDGREAVGYTRSIEKNGHVHMVFARAGRTDADYDRFACTLVHEGTHAFLHRLYGPRLLPHWVNEGFADLMADRILGERCPNGQNAALLARQYARFDWPIAGLLESASTIEVHQYPLAHSIVSYLDGLGRNRFAGFIKSLKNGHSASEALAENYEGMTLAGLAQSWKTAIRDTYLPAAEVSGIVTVEKD